MVFLVSVNGKNILVGLSVIENVDMVECLVIKLLIMIYFLCWWMYVEYVLNGVFVMMIKCLIWNEYVDKFNIEEFCEK